MSGPPADFLEPFFLSGPNGRLFCLFVGPRLGSQRRGAVLIVPPFAEEMNKARRQLSLQARRLAALGYAVLLPDLYGTGDSEGDFVEAGWDKWLSDLHAAEQWLRAQATGRLVVVALRFGALLAAELSRQTTRPPDQMILWQPVVSGRQYIEQFLRLRVAAALVGARDAVTVRALREMLSGGAAVEVAGYELRPELVREIDARELTMLVPPQSVAIDWIELASDDAQRLSPAAERVVSHWAQSSARVRATTVIGEQFWSTVEIVVTPALIEKTAQLVMEMR